MRASLLLIAVRAGTAIVVSTAAVQFWAIAVKGETPRLTPSLALPPTATAVAAVVPHRNVKPKKLRPAKHKAGSKPDAHPTSSSSQPAAPVTPQPASAPEPAAAPPRAQPAQQADAAADAGESSGPGGSEAEVEPEPGGSGARATRAHTSACLPRAHARAPSGAGGRLRFGTHSAQTCEAAGPMLGTWERMSQRRGAGRNASTRCGSISASTASGSRLSSSCSSGETASGSSGLPTRPAAPPGAGQ